jgi:hypothetical protein
LAGNTPDLSVWYTSRASLAVQRYGGRLGDRRYPLPREDSGRVLRLPLPRWRDVRAARFRR